MGDSSKDVSMQALKFLPVDCKSDALEVLKYRRVAFDLEGIPCDIKGYRMIPCFEEDCAQYAYDHVDLKKGDVLIASYPKTGTTWMQAIVNHILHGDNPEELEKYSALRRFVFYLEVGPVKKYDIWKKLSLPQQVFATHLPASLVNLKKYKENGAKVICTIRNPKDQMVSWRNFFHSMAFSKLDHWKPLAPENEKEFYDVYLSGKQNAFAKEGEGYLECLREWYHYKDDENFLFVVYEELRKAAGGTDGNRTQHVNTYIETRRKITAGRSEKELFMFQNPKKEIKRIAEFIGHCLTEENLSDVVVKTSLKSMKENYGKKGFHTAQDASLMGKGNIGEWKNHLTVAQSELVDRKVKKILGDTDIEFIYE